MNKSATETLLALLIETLNSIIGEVRNLDECSLKTVINQNSQDPDTISIQTILTHVIFSGYRYINYISKKIGIEELQRKKNILNSSEHYQKELRGLIMAYKNLFNYLTDEMLEETKLKYKIKTSWSQTYDIEQLIEHSIVHNSRHLLQIKKYKTSL